MDIAQEMKNIRRVIDMIPDEMQKTILTKRYISNKPWDVICSEIGYEKTKVFEMHGWALATVNRMLERRMTFTY
jgi:hypothetical protein